jgi:hypothetical protein
MILVITRYKNRHRPAPVREAVVVRCKNADCCAQPPRKIMAVHADMDHLSQYFISQIDWFAPSNSRANIQIPIGRRLI